MSNTGYEEPQKQYLDGFVTVTLRYLLQNGETEENIKVYYEDRNGEIALLPSTYSDGYITFETDCFSDIAVTSADYLSPPSVSGVNGNDEESSGNGSDYTAISYVVIAALLDVIGVIGLIALVRR